MRLRPGALLETPFSVFSLPIKFNLNEQKIKIVNSGLVSFNVVYHANVMELERNRVQQIDVSLVTSGSVLATKKTDYTMSVPNGARLDALREPATFLTEIASLPTVSLLMTTSERIIGAATDGIVERVAIESSLPETTITTREETSFFPVSFTFDEFSIKDILEDDIQIIFSCVNNNGIELLRKTETIPFNKIIDTLTYPLLPPKLESSYAIEDGFLDLLITQQEPNAYGIQLYKRKLYDIKNEWTLVGDVITDEHKTVLIKDRNNSTGVVEYRAICYNKNNISGFNFSSTTAEISKKPGVSKLIKLEDNITISWSYATDAQNTLKIEVFNIPVTATAIALISRDLINNNEKYVLSSGFVPMNGNINESVTFFDNNCFENHVYEYYVKIQYINGIQRESTTRIIVPYKKILNNVVKTQLTITKTSSDSELSIVGEIATNFIERDESLIKEAVSQNGLLSFFNNDFSRDKLNSLIVYEIYRKSISTNQIEYLGTTTKTSFNDKEQSEIFNCDPAKFGEMYQYTVFTLIRNSFGALPETTETITKIPTETYSPWFWQRPRVLNTGTLSTLLAEAKNFAGNVFTQGNLVDVVTAELNIQESLPTISSFEYQNLPFDYGKLSWVVAGENKKIDSFMIFGLRQQEKVLLGNAHSFSGNKKFTLLFKKINGVVFEKFRLIPYFINYNTGREVETTA
jgi:hypothetical protein